MPARAFALVVFAAIACGCQAPAPPVSGDNVFILTPAELAVEQRKASDGDLKAIQRLILHYEASPGGDPLAEKWHAKALALGDPKESYDRAARLEAEARMQQSPERRIQMLKQAKILAESSLNANPDPSTRKLLADISEAIEKESPRE